MFEHNEGVGAAYTRRRRPVRLVWTGEFERIDEAFAMEKRIQGWSRAKRQALIDDRTDGAGRSLEPQLGSNPGAQGLVKVLVS